MIWTAGDVSASQTLTALDHLKFGHINELREAVAAGAGAKYFVSIGPSGSGCDFEIDASGRLDIKYQLAVDQIGALGGGTIMLNTGTFDNQFGSYYFDQRVIILYPNILNSGAGVGATKITLNDNVNQEMFVIGNGFAQDPVVDVGYAATIRPCHNVGFQHMELDGNKAGQEQNSAVYLANRYGISATRNIIRPRADAQTTYGGFIQDVYVHDAMQNGISIESPLDFNVFNNRADNCAGFGIWSENGRDVFIGFNRCKTNTMAGIKVFSCGDVNVIGNHSTSNDGGNYSLQTVKRFAFVGNQSHRSGWHGLSPAVLSHGLSVSDAQVGSFSDNSFFGSYGSGMSLQGTSKCSFVGNNFRQNGQLDATLIVAGTNSHNDILMTGAACTNNAFIANKFDNTTDATYPNKSRYNIVEDGAAHTGNTYTDNKPGTPEFAFMSSSNVTTQNRRTGGETITDTTPEQKLESSGDLNDTRLRRSSTDGSARRYNTAAGLEATLHSVLLDGSNDNVTVAHSAGLNVTTAFTLIAFVKMDTLPSSSRFIDKNYTLTVLANGKLRCTIPSVADISDTGSTTVSAGVWTPVAITHSGTDYKFYINSGTANSTIVNVNNPGSGTGILTLSPSGGRVDGRMGATWIYSRALTGTELGDLFTSGTEPDETGLVARWRWTEDSGTTAADSSGNGNTATLNSGAAFDADIPAVPIEAGITDSEFEVWSSEDSAVPGEEGVQTFGHDGGRTVIAAKTLHLDMATAPASETVTPDRTITVTINGANYKIPAKVV